MLDTGSSSTIIDAGFARHYNLTLLSEPYDKQCSYMDRVVKYETVDVELTIVSQDTKVSRTLQAQTVNGFTRCCYLQDWSSAKKLYEHLHDIVIPKSPYPPLGTVLIGTDYPFIFDVLETRRGGESEPIANRTLLGWALMGPKPHSDDEEDSGNKMDTSNISNSKPPGSSSWTVVSSILTKSEDFLAEMVARQFDLEHLGLQEREQNFSKAFSGGPKDPVLWSPAEKRADDKMTVTRSASQNYYTVKIPWCDGYEQRLKDNFFPVKNRQDRSHAPLVLAKKEITIDEIDLIIQGYIEKGYIEPVPESEKGQGWYLPFFEVVNRHKSTPIRLVFDAKASYNGISLNSQIEDTPNRLNDLVITLLNLRRYEFALTADISEMFLRIRLDPEDKKYHRFYHNTAHYQWTRILFGNKSSPNASQKVLVTANDQFKTVYPVACETVRKSIYMDDVADSKSTERELLTLAQQLPKLLGHADMKICKFYTNSRLVVENMPRDLLAKEIHFKDKDPFFDSNMVLGMVWDANTDLLTFKTKYSTVDEWKAACKVQQWTKRSVLQTTASTFDPLGLLSPIITYPRLIIQQLWSENLGWDDPIGDNMSKKWEQCLINILKVRCLSFPRWIRDADNSKLELHVFCDASETAYATVIYSRVIAKGGKITTLLVMAKSRIAPLKNETVSRLELVACVLGTRLLTAVNLSYNIDPQNVFYYTDSRNSLCWINTPSSKAKTYVFNRTAEIQRATKLTQWSHVKTELNPADIATRYIETDDLVTSKLWFEGPDFLKDPDYRFVFYQKDVEDLSKEGEAELKPLTETMNPIPYSQFTLFSNFVEDKLFETFSETNIQASDYLNLLKDFTKPGFYKGQNILKLDSTVLSNILSTHLNQKTIDFWYSRLERVSVGKLYNGFSKFRKTLSVLFKRVCAKPISAIETNQHVWNFLYRLSQQASFPEELRLISRSQKLKQGNLLCKLNPFIDHNGILRSNSRLDSLDYLPEETRRPVILLGTDLITKLIAAEIHWQFEHAVSRSLVLATLHKSYYILGITRLVKELASCCVECKRLRANPAIQQMSNLKHLNPPHRAFSETGIDFAGPFEIVQGRGKVRRQAFVLVLTCLQTRAVHFEPTRDQTTNSVIMALTRFSSIRGRPVRIVSDNQTSFKGASSELKAFYGYFRENAQSIVEGLNNQFETPIDWVFITPRSPHFGGAWEIMVKAMKRAMNALSKNQSMNEDTFCTYLCIAMNMINNRPLLKHYSQDTPHFLTPNCFLVGLQDTNLVPSVENVVETKLGSRWRQLETLANQLWHRFIQEILPELAPRQKWKQLFDNLTIGTVVLVVDPGQPRGLWKTGLVTQVELGRDGLVREATVRIGQKEYSRPLARLIPLTD